MQKFKKITLKFPTPKKYAWLFKKLSRCEILQIHRFDKNYAIYTQKFVFKTKDTNPKALEKFCNISIENLSENKSKNEYICLVKCHWDEELNNFFNNSDLMIYPPVIQEENFMTITYITDSKFVDALIGRYKRIYGNQLKLINISYVKPDLNNLTMLLTEKQKSIIYYAVEKGYYEIPRKINAGDLARHFEISNSAVHEHLRRIERKIFNTLCL